MFAVERLEADNVVIFYHQAAFRGEGEYEVVGKEPVCQGPLAMNFVLALRKGFCCVELSGHTGLSVTVWLCPLREYF